MLKSLLQKEARMSDKTERERFEAWMKADRPHASLERADETDDCDYIMWPIEMAWVAWQARAALDTGSVTDKASTRPVPAGQTPLDARLSHPLLLVFAEGEKARDTGAASPYHGHSLEHCLHAAGWVQRDLMIALDAAKKRLAAPQPPASASDGKKPVEVSVKSPPAPSLDVDALAQEIRRVDSNHDLGAGALAEALMPFLSGHSAHPDAYRQGAEEMPTAWHDVIAERRRQISVEEWTPDNDDDHEGGEMALAAAAYAENAARGYDGDICDEDPPYAWPWADKWWKPTTRRRDLVKAGALILAEIERLDRASLSLATRRG